MTYIGIREENDVTAVFYKATWDYDYGYMLLFFQSLIDEDLGPQLTYAVAGDQDETHDFLDEALRVKGQLRHCRTLLREKSYISVAGYSQAMDCDVRLTLWTGTNHVQLEVQQKPELFREHGSHVFDVYMNSYEIMAYMEAARQDAVSQYRAQCAQGNGTEGRDASPEIG
jgi:hypothetical protein